MVLWWVWICLFWLVELWPSSTSRSFLNSRTSFWMYCLTWSNCNTSSQAGTKASERCYSWVRKCYWSVSCFHFILSLWLCRYPLWRTAKFSGCWENHCQKDSKCAGWSRGFSVAEHGGRHGGNQVTSPAPNQSILNRHFANSKLCPTTTTAHTHTHTHTQSLNLVHLIDSLGVR